MKILGFYFVALINDWENIVNEQIKTLFQSELFLSIDKLYIHIYDPNNNLDIFKKILLPHKKIIISSNNENEYEFGMLKIIKNLSKYENFYCFYFHAKGVSITESNMGFYGVKDFNSLKNNVTSWRRYLDFFLIDLYKKNLLYLNNGFDCVGVQLTKTPKLHYSGNFWWTTSEYLKKLPEINTLNLNHRWDAELWIGLGNGKMKNLFTTSQAGYKQTIVIDYKIESLNE